MTGSVPQLAWTPEGPILMGGWPAQMIATREFIEYADSAWVQREWRNVRFEAVNACAIYRIAARGPYPHSYVLWRVSQVDYRPKIEACHIPWITEQLMKDFRD